MASVPPQSSVPSRRQSSSSPPAAESQRTERSSNSRSVTTEDSQTILLNDSAYSLPSPGDEHRRKPVPDNEARKCWICFADETEDTPSSSAWRSPCPCALTAHEACLLDWVADLEAPNQRKGTGSPLKIQCPQCKSDINVARPRSLIVTGVNAVRQATGRLVFPGVLLTLAGSIFTGCWLHGVTTVYLIFGPRDADVLFGVDTGEGISGSWGFGLPLIPVVLVLSRTAIANNYLPVLPIFFFASQIPDLSSRDLWPPSAAMTIASLPYFRGAYNEVYQRIFADREKGWIRDVQPRAGETGDDAGAPEQQDVGLGDREAGVDIDFQLEVGVEIIEEEEVGNQQQPDRPAAEALGAENGGMNRDQGQLPGQARQNNLIVSTSHLADTIMGALLFPTISAAMGGILKATLPRTWTTPPGPWDRYRVGLLQTRWGRSIVGGCLFVVLKDTLLLYSRYRLAQDHRKRRIVDFNREKGMSKAGS
ncbi:hypothetical protein MMC12_007707 [Toensbergia leucococca]|nr:hypothetical protein [Toensbergia leucococca]